MSDGVGGEVGKVKAVVGDGCARPLKLNANEKKKSRKNKLSLKLKRKSKRQQKIISRASLMEIKMVAIKKKKNVRWE